MKLYFYFFEGIGQKEVLPTPWIRVEECEARIGKDLFPDMYVLLHPVPELVRERCRYLVFDECDIEHVLNAYPDTGQYTVVLAENDEGLARKILKSYFEAERVAAEEKMHVAEKNIQILNMLEDIK